MFTDGLCGSSVMKRSAIEGSDPSEQVTFPSHVQSKTERDRKT